MNDCVPSFESYKKKYPEFTQEISCVENYLSLYDWFTQDQNNAKIRKELYNQTLKLLQNGIDTRKKQANITLEQSKKFSEELIKKYPDVFKMRDGKLVRDFSKYEKVSMEDKTLAARIIILQGVIKDVMDESVVFLKGILDKCKAPGTTNVLCIETFVNAAHNKGPYIPIGCGLPYPEYGEDISENKEERINVVGRLMAKETVDALNCIHDRKRI